MNDSNTHSEVPKMRAEDMSLRIYPDKVLMQDGALIVDFDDQLRRNVARMKELMVEYRGIGLAAHQVGWPVRLFVISIPRKREDNADTFEEVEDTMDERTVVDEYVFINPEYTGQSRQQTDFEEGCLSFPDIRARIRRPTRVEVTAYDEHGVQFTLEAGGLLARCIQHEYDHIRGQLFNRLWTPATQTRHSGRIKDLQNHFEEFEAVKKPKLPSKIVEIEPQG